MVLKSVSANEKLYDWMAQVKNCLRDVYFRLKEDRHSVLWPYADVKPKETQVLNIIQV